MKRSELIFGAILLPIDYIMLAAAGLSAYFLRFNTTVVDWVEVTYEIPFNSYFAVVLITAVAWVGIFALSGLYNIRGTRRIVEEVRKIFLACSTGVLLIIVLFFFNRDLFSSRFIILVAFAIAVFYVSAARLIVLYIERSLFKKGIGVINTVLIGENHVTKLVANELSNNKALGFHVRLQFADFNEEARKKTEELIEKDLVDEIIQTDPNISRAESKVIFEFCDEHHITYKYAAALLDTQLSNIAIRPIGGIPIVELKQTRLDGWGRILKRIFDIIGSTIFIIVLSPLIVAAMIVVVLDSGFPIFFSRKDDGTKVKRIGQHGKPFFYFKLRTMKPKTDSLRYEESMQDQNIRKGSPLVKIVDDPRVTRIGKVLRKYSIDELPELFLVLKGDMSLVGPRPHLPEEVAQYNKHQKGALRIKPGMTGMSQVSGRSDLEFADEVRLDTFYVENWSLWLDIIILLKTPLILFKKRKAL
ncbi:MAG: sugar transferase [Candidatus Kerfeldbacteria bacterium]